jgi:tRNA 2-thiouridine synthesizing protein C
VKTILFVVRTAPYGSAGIPESVRNCLGFATMPLDLNYLLLDDATWALAPGQKPAAIGNAAIPDLLEGLADADVKLYADAESLADRALSVEGLAFEVQALTREQIRDLIAGSDAVLTY